MATFIDELLGKTLDQVAALYTQQNAIKASGCGHSKKLAHHKRCKANELIETIRFFFTHEGKALAVLPTNFEEYKNSILNFITENSLKVQDLCKTVKNATFGNYAHFISTLNYVVILFFKLCEKYCILFPELEMDIAEDLRLTFSKTMIDYELEAEMQNKFYENDKLQIVYQAIINSDKHKRKVDAMHALCLDLNEMLTRVGSDNKETANRIIFSYTNTALRLERSIQYSISGTSEIGSSISKIAHFAFGSITSIGQKALSYVRENKLEGKLKALECQVQLALPKSSFLSSL